MSVFQVNLQSIYQGKMDLNPSTATPVLVGDNGTPYLGSQMNPSIQRTINVAGPQGIYRELTDGQTFTDCNYWKRFAYPQVPLSQAFITVVTDDGSPWSDYTPGENNYPLAFGGGVTSYTVSTTDTFATNYIDILGSYGSYATFVQITNNGTLAGQNIQVQLNGSNNSIIALAYGQTQTFDVGDFAISKLAFKSGVTGTSAANTTVQVVLAVQSIPNS